MVSRSIVVFLGVLVLAGCASADSSPEAVCRRQVTKSPAARALWSQATFERWSRQEYAAHLDQLEKTAVQRCLQRQSGTAPGGVEPVQKPIP